MKSFIISSTALFISTCVHGKEADFAYTYQMFWVFAVP